MGKVFKQSVFCDDDICECRWDNKAKNERVKNISIINGIGSNNRSIYINFPNEVALGEEKMCEIIKSESKSGCSKPREKYLNREKNAKKIVIQNAIQNVIQNAKKFKRDGGI